MAKRWPGLACASAAALLAIGAWRVPRAAEEGRSGRSPDSAPERAAVSPTANQKSVRKDVTEKSSTPSPPETDDDWVVDWRPESDEPPKVVWQKEEGGWTATLDETGAVSIVGPTRQEYQTLSAQEMGRLEVPNRLRAEARSVMREKLPMKLRAVWEKEQEEKRIEAAEARGIRPLDPHKLGFASAEEMNAALKKKFNVENEKDVTFFERRTTKGEYEVAMRVVGIQEGDPDF